MKKTLSVLIMLACLERGYAASINVPAGFEILTQGQQERVEVILAGKEIGLFDAIVSLDTVKFIEPEKVLAALELPVTPADKDYPRILTALSAPLARNGGAACGYGTQTPGCGYINSDSVDAIYDDNESSVTLFMRKEWMPVSGAQALYRTPTTHDVQNAFIHQQDLNLIAQDDYSSLFLQGAGALGVTENSYFGMHWSLNASQYEDDESEYTADVSDLYYRYDFNRRYYAQLGRIDSRTLFSTQGGNFNFSFLPLDSIDGLRIGSTLSYFNYEQGGQGTPLVVLLSRNSRVDAYRNEQLLGSFYLPPGNQSVDTSMFPNGSYNVQLRIYESNQLVRTENQPFTKTGGMDDGRVHWFMQGGQISDPESDDAAAFQAGLRLPLLNTLSLTAGGASVDNQLSAELGVDYSPDFGAYGNLGLSAHLYQGEENRQGDSEQLSWSLQGWPSLSLYRYASSGDQCAAGYDDDGSDYNRPGCYESLNVTLTDTLYDWTMMLGYIQTENNSDDALRWDDNTDFEDNVLRQTTENATSRTLQFSASRAFSYRDWMINSTLGLFRRDDEGYDNSDNGVYVTFSLSQSPRQDSDARSQMTEVSADYRSSRQSSDQLAYNVSHTWYQDNTDHRELSVEAGGINTDTLDAAVSGRLEGAYGNLSAALSDSYDTQENRHATALTATYNSTFAVSRQGLYWGAAGFGDPASAVVVEVENLDESDDQIAVDAQVAGNRRTPISQGGSVLFPMMSYEPGSIDVRDSTRSDQGGTTSLISGAGAGNVMLLPGKMRRRSVTVEHRYGYVGRLLLPAGAHENPVIGLNTHMLLLSEDRSFTAEFTRIENDLYLLSGRDVYRCPLVVQKQRAIVRYVGESQCRAIAMDDLPAEMRDQARIKIKTRTETETAYRAPEGTE
ncbi:TcfC E-set like domain-containing protein [Chimaeribacter arupi]|uniref:TcfC E-set like domain-containing protein n=1 Tax=Chimaeribacter arupi TaxID=2060066 RepID=UPI000C7BD577|nr:TcfC E-set like domain-containing protein [Chimaeribacter arupi]PLR47126.1 hypothetical protein CYR52_14725 [Chimaeribacter arupi]